MKNHHPKFLYPLVILFISSVSYSQLFDYKKELIKRMFPATDTTSSKILATYLAVTDLEAEHSIRIIQVGNQSYIEAHIVEKNLQKELSLYGSDFLRMKENVPFNIKTTENIALISNSFRDKMLKVFARVIEMTKIARDPTNTLNADGTITLMAYDGPTYEFTTHDNRKLSCAEIIYPLDSTDFRYLVTKTNQQLVNDLMNNLFDESKYTIFN